MQKKSIEDKKVMVGAFILPELLKKLQDFAEANGKKTRSWAVNEILKIHFETPKPLDNDIRRNE